LNAAKPGPLNELLEAVTTLRETVNREAQPVYETWCRRIVRRGYYADAKNLALYLSLRKYDLRALQNALPVYGLTSLTGIEAQVLQTLDGLTHTLNLALGKAPATPQPTPQRYYRGRRALDRNTTEVFGATASQRSTRIMVTLPGEAAGDSELLTRLCKSGMDWVRINCAHDDPDTWRGLIEALRVAEGATGKRCGILMDLGGPKVRVGEVIRPKKSDKLLEAGDTLLLTRDAPQKSATYKFQAQCMIPEALEQVQVGHAVFLDDGMVGMRVTAKYEQGIELKIERTPPEGYKLKPEKGLNFPDTGLAIPALTAKDREDLRFVVQYADAVGYSFVQTAQDVQLLLAQIAQHSDLPRAKALAIIAKIETTTAVYNLPEIMVEAAGKVPFGVMIARGDLSVELGWARTAEMQEEILWLCEAAHIPVIWATQVLESFVKTGLPTRAEMTDAAMGERAECIMLNKGPNIVEAVVLLDGLLIRMEGHRSKQRARMRPLLAWSS